MILREIFEARAKAKSVGIIFGRFNPPHMGHMKAWEMASENSVWYVGTNKSTQGPKDPLPFGIKVKAMEAVYPEVKGHVVAEQSWLTLASKVYEKHGNIVLNVYTDEDWVTKTLIQYNGKEGAHGYYEFGTIQQQTTPRLSSATSLRNAVAADDRDLFGQAAGVDPNTLVAGHPFFDVVKHYLTPYVAKAAAKPVKKKVKQPVEEPVAENSSISTMPTTEYVKGIYAAAAENGMGAPAVEAVRKQMVLAPNGEVDIMATMQKALQVFQSPAWKKMIADLTALVKKAEAQQGVTEGTSIESTLRAVINDIGEPVTNVYDTMKFQAKKYMENHGELDRGFRMVAAGIGGRWVQNMYVGRLQNELYDLCKYNTRRTVELQQFLRGVEADGELEMKRSFGNIANELPRILVKLGQHLDAPQLTKNANRWMQNKAAYEEYIANLELEDDYDEPAVAKSPKNPAIGQQRSQVEDIVNDILSKLPKKIAGDIRNAIARSPNKLQALQAELQKHGQKSVAENKLGNVLPWPAVANKVSSAMKAMGWKGQRQSDDAFMFSTKGQLDDEFYIVVIESEGNNFFSYALGTVEDGDPYIDDAFKGRLPNTEASISELMNEIRSGYGLDEGVAENAWDRLQRERALESAGVGIITKQNSTVDVNKNTPKKNLKAFRLA
jgi:hypothetical protein